MPVASSTENSPGFAYAPGDLIASKYLLEQLIGEGGMGAVFRARNTSLDMPVAIKLLRAGLDRELLSGRLLQEARAVAKLAHPAIVRVFDVGQTALGDPFIVMELLDGETLSALMDRQRGLTAIHAVQLLLPIADALSAAHAKGLVHRDVKPDNVLLVVSDEGMLQPKLLDFGIVKSAQTDGSSGPSDAGSIVGSPDYMSPEQARGLERVDARSDLWSFSVVLYEAIAGFAPFQRDDYAALLRAIVENEPPSLAALGLASDTLSQIVTRGLSKDPAARYASLSEMGRLLAAWLADQGITEDACGVSLEAKWLAARRTEPQALGRSSWPSPARAEQLSGITIPPSSLAPSADSSRGPERAPRRSLPVVIAAALLALPLAWLAVGSMGSESSRPPAASPVTRSALLDTGVALPPPVAIASTVAPVTPLPSTSARTSNVPPAREKPGPNPARKKTLTRPKASAPASAAAKPERLSDLLAPMPF